MLDGATPSLCCPSHGLGYRKGPILNQHLMASLFPRVTFLRNIHPALLTRRAFSRWSYSSRELCLRTDLGPVASPPRARVENTHGPLVSTPIFQDWYTSPSQDWYTSPSLPPYSSCDWAAWGGTEMWVPDPHSSILPVEVDFIRLFRLPGPIEPLAFYDPNGCADFDCFAFRCGERYYFYDYDSWAVRQYHGRFASPGAFLSARIDSFYEVAPTSPRLAELYPVWRELWQSCPVDKERIIAVEQEQESARLNPPPSELYTQIFPPREAHGPIETRQHP
ncbi:hypothetical protein K438DRAFT_1835662 [Mycena galopus ATCC 62051]|nr:hypothetical protein K438DRAFT_1835662 [Mycena galopus ATCC 62051]